MTVVNLSNGIYKTLAKDGVVLNYLGIGPTATSLMKAKRIQKRSKPTSLIENLPLITFFLPPGRRGGNNMDVYSTQAQFDIYTKDDVDLAQKLGSRIIELFEGEIPPMDGVTTFESLFVSAHETPSDLANTYCFTVVVQFSIEIER